MAGVGFVAAVLEATVLRDRHGVGKVDRMARLDQTVHQPVPVEFRFHDDAKQILHIRAERIADVRQVVGSASAREWEECREMLLERQVWRGAGNGTP